MSAQTDSLLDEFFPRATTPAPLASDPRPLSWADAAAPTPAPRKPRRSVDLGKIGERWAAKHLPAFGFILARALTTSAWRDGRQVWTSTDVDYTGTLRSLPVCVECKTFTADFKLSGISDNEKKYLARPDRLSVLCLVAVTPGGVGLRDVCAVWLVRWQDWLRIEAALAARASGNYRGRSLRVADRDLLAAFALEKPGRSWRIPAGHWAESAS